MFTKSRSRLLGAACALTTIVGATVALSSTPASAAGSPLTLSMAPFLQTPASAAIWIGSPFTYQVIVRNEGGMTGTEQLVDSATLTGSMPGVLTMNVTPTIFGALPAGVTASCASSTTTVVNCTMNGLAVGQSIAFRISGVAPANLDPTTVVQFTLNLNSPQDGSPKSSTLSNAIDPFPSDIAVTTGSAVLPVGGTASLPLTIANVDAMLTTLSTVTARLEIPTPTAGVTISTIPPGCVAVASPPVGKLQWDCTTPGSMLPNTSQVFNFGVSATAPGASTTIPTVATLVTTPTVNDTNGTNNTANGSISVGPTAANDTISTPFNTTFTGSTLSSNDVIALGATYSRTSTAANGTATLTPAGQLTYVPNTGFTGQDSFTYSVSNPNGLLATATVTLLIAPSATNDTATTIAGSAVTATVNTNDVAAAGATWARTTNPANGTATVTATGGFTYTPAPGFSGVDSFTYTVSNPGGATAMTTVTITVAPRAMADAVSTTAGQATNSSVAPNDVYASGAIFSKLTNPANGAVTFNADGSFVYTPAAGFSGTDSFTYRVANLDGANASATVSITVRPFATNDSNSTTVDVAVSGSVTANDVFAVGATFASTVLPAHGTVSVAANGTYTYNPASGYIGADSFTYTVTNPDGSTATAMVTINIALVLPTAPIAVNDTFSLPYGSVASGTVANNDSWLPGATWAVTTAASNGTVIMTATGSYVYTPAAGFSGPATFGYTITNPNGKTSTAIVTIHVGPRVIADSINTTVGTAVSGDAATNDNVAVGATFATATNPANGSVVVNGNGTYTYTPAPGFSGIDSFTYTATNPDGSKATTMVTVHVGPRAGSSSVVTTGSVSGNANTGGLGATGATCALQIGTTHGTLILNPDCTYTYTVVPSYTGQDSFVYRLTNPDGLSSDGTVTINIRKTGSLPETGGDVRDGLVLAGLFSLLGVGLVLIGRRRRTLQA